MLFVGECLLFRLVVLRVFIGPFIIQKITAKVRLFYFDWGLKCVIAFDAFIFRLLHVLSLMQWVQSDS